MGGSMDNQVGNMLTKTLLRLAPKQLHNLIFRVIVDKTINRNHNVRQRLHGINGKTFCLDVRDIKRNYSFYIDEGRVIVDFDGKRKPDVVMQGNFDTFLKLFFHKADADSLFFSRKLVIKGDVETSVFFKNLLEHL